MKKQLFLCTFMCAYSTTSWALDLVQAYQRALTTDSSWQANQTRFKVEQQNLGIAKGAILPTVVVNAVANKQYMQQDDALTSINFAGQEVTFQNDDTTTRQVALNIRQPLFRMDVWEQYKKVKISQQLAELKLQSQEQELLLNVAKNYFTVLRQQHLLKVYRQEEQALLQQYKMMNAKLEEGLVARIEVSEADAQYQSIIAKRVYGEVQLQLAIEQLEQLIGHIQDDLASLSTGFVYQSPIPADINAWVAMAERNNLMLNQYRISHQIAKQQIKVDQASYYPQVEAVASTAWMKQDPESVLMSAGRTDKVGIELNWLAFDGTRQKIVKKSQLEANAAYIDIDVIRKQTYSTTKKAYLQVATGYTQLNAYKVAMQSAELVAQASQASYQEGLKTMVDVLLARRNAFSAQQDYVNAQYDYILSVLDLRAVSGQLNEQDLQHFNQWLE